MLNKYPNTQVELSSSEPISIALDDTVNFDRSAATINADCQSIIRSYLHQNLGLTVDIAYPTDLKFTQFITQLVTGFVLTVVNTRIVFIPSEDLDYCGFEIEQEWVDLSNWAADYYVPVQVDLDGKFLNLWGFISHRDVQEQGELDDISRTYLIDSQYMSDDLDDLWLTCELIASKEMSPECGVVLPISELSHQTVEGLIDTLRGHHSIFSPRLDLDFEQWGAILNQSKYLELYLNPVPVKAGLIVQTIPRVITRLSDWLDGQSAAIYEDWKSIRKFFNIPQVAEEHRSSTNEYLISPVGKLTICPQIDSIYHSAGANTEALVEIIRNTNSQHERWEAIEYLWKLDPDHPALPIYKLLDLGLFFQGEQLSLLISIIPTKTERLGVLIRLSPNSEFTQLPRGIQLSRLAEDGKISRQKITEDDMSQCLQLIFDAKIGYVFSICVTLNDKQLIKHFQI